MKQLPREQRPYEKCFMQGEGSLNDTELLAVILRSGTSGKNSLALAQEILKFMESSSYPGLMGLMHVSVQDLMKIHGIGQVKAVQLKCIGELSKRIAKAAARPQIVMNNPSSIAAYYMEELRHEEQELVICMMSDVKGHFLGDKILTRGTATGSLVTPREIFMEALRRHAVSLILIHNHPSGDPTPSPDDLQITARIYQAGELLGIHLLDHIVIGDQRYCSFREEGLWNTCTDMFEKSPTDITVTSPMTFGMIANLELQEIVLYSMIRKIDHILGFGATMYFTVPLDMTAVEKRAYFHVANGHWLKKNRVFMVEAPIADAIAMGVNLEDPEGNMIVNIGAQSTEVSIITGGKIIISRKIPLGGRQMNESVCSEIRKRYNLQIGTRTAKRLKMVMGRLSDPKKEVRKVVGIDCISGLPREEIISSYVVNDGIMNCLNEIAAEMKTFLERIPPQISYHIAKQGIYITGGSTRLPYIDKYLASYTGFTFNLSDFYETSAVTGLEKIIRNKELREWAVPVTQRKL